MSTSGSLHQHDEQEIGLFLKSRGSIVAWLCPQVVAVTLIVKLIQEKARRLSELSTMNELANVNVSQLTLAGKSNY